MASIFTSEVFAPSRRYLFPPTVGFIQYVMVKSYKAVIDECSKNNPHTWLLSGNSKALVGSPSLPVVYYVYAIPVPSAPGVAKFSKLLFKGKK